MRIYREFDINDFEAWSGAVDTKENIINAGKADLFNSLMDDIFPDGADETAVNDFLRFDTESIYEMLGLNEDGEEPEEETPDFSNYDDFESFCCSFGNGCEHCPFRDISGDCEESFNQEKEAAEA